MDGGGSLRPALVGDFIAGATFRPGDTVHADADRVAVRRPGVTADGADGAGGTEAGLTVPTGPTGRGLDRAARSALTGPTGPVERRFSARATAPALAPAGRPGFTAGP